MRAPQAETEYARRCRDCADAIRDDILRLVAQAQSVGWRADDVGEALIALGDVLVSVDGLKTLKSCSSAQVSNSRRHQPI